MAAARAQQLGYGRGVAPRELVPQARRSIDLVVAGRVTSSA
jgi:hypothetical protein